MQNTTLSKYINEYKAVCEKIRPLEDRQSELKKKIVDLMGDEKSHETAKGFTAYIYEKHKDYIPVNILKTVYTDIWEKEHKTTTYKQLSVR